MWCMNIPFRAWCFTIIESVQAHHFATAIIWIVDAKFRELVCSMHEPWLDDLGSKHKSLRMNWDLPDQQELGHSNCSIMRWHWVLNCQMMMQQEFSKDNDNAICNGNSLQMHLRTVLFMWKTATSATADWHPHVNDENNEQMEVHF